MLHIEPRRDHAAVVVGAQPGRSFKPATYSSRCALAPTRDGTSRKNTMKTLGLDGVRPSPR
jgi:hypothetical protein